MVYSPVKAGEFNLSIRTVYTRLHHDEEIDEILDYGACTVGELQWLPPNHELLRHTTTIVVDDDVQGRIGNYLAMVLVDQTGLEIILGVTNSNGDVKAKYTLEDAVITQVSTSARTRFTDDYEKECRFTLTVTYSRAARSN